MNIKIKLTREENASYYNKKIGDVVEIPFETYLCGVVASEIGTVYLEACRAQAVASRTFAYPYASAGKTISDSSSSHQAFRASRLNQDNYSIAHQAVKDTTGEILYYENDIVSPCAFSSSNHGRTTSSQSRWGGYRPYLIEQDDPWDQAASYSKSRGHGVGMSQVGARYAAKQGISYRDILSFYYPGTRIVKEGAPMAQVKASDLIPIFKQMEEEKWKYVAGARKQGEVDCSGAFYYAYKKLGSYMYHGSNTMYRKYTTKKEKIGNIELKPGMAVFKLRSWTSSQSSNGWYKTDPGDMYHVGLYIGDGLVVEAQGKKTGVVITKISTWHYAAELTDTIYDVQEEEATNQTTGFSEICMGIVTTSGGFLNLRTGPALSYSRAAKANNGDALCITGSTLGWYEIDYNGKKLYASQEYVKLCDSSSIKKYLFKVVVREQNKKYMERLLEGYEYTIEELSDAA